MAVLHSASIAESLKFAVLPIVKVLVMCGIGYLLATRRIGLLTSTGIKILSKLVFMVFLPCLIFTQLGSAITFKKMLDWWFIPVNIVVASVVGCAIGCVVVWIVKPPPQFKKYTIVAIGIGNIGNVPLVLMDAICRDTSSPFGDYETCSSQGVAYISYGQWVGAVIVYTFVYHMLSPPDDHIDSNTPELDRHMHSSLTVSLIGNVEEGKDDKDDGKTIIQSFSVWVIKAAKNLMFAALKCTRCHITVTHPPMMSYEEMLNRKAALQLWSCEASSAQLAYAKTAQGRGGALCV